MVTRWYELERAGRLSDMDRLFLEQATTQPLSFHEVLWSEPSERIGLRDILIGTETEVVERSASRALQRGDIAYGQIWTESQNHSERASKSPRSLPARLYCKRS